MPRVTVSLDGGLAEYLAKGAAGAGVTQPEYVRRLIEADRAEEEARRFREGIEENRRKVAGEYGM